MSYNLRVLFDPKNKHSFDLVSMRRVEPTTQLILSVSTWATSSNQGKQDN